MATNALLTPFAVYKAIEDAKRRGGPSDYYGLGKALEGVGNSWDSMQRTMGNTFNLQRTEAEVNAALESGYYPARAARDVSQFNLGAYQNQDQLKTAQDIQNAFNSTLGEGKYRPNTPEFEMEMQNKLQTVGATSSRAKNIAEARQQLQSRDVQVAIVKEGTERQIAQKIAKKYYEDHEQAFVASKLAQGVSVQQAKMELARQSRDEAIKYIREYGLQVRVDPITGMIEARDKHGVAAPINANVLAAAFASGGHKDAFNALATLTRSQFLYGDQAQENATMKASRTSTPAKQGPTRLDALRAQRDKIELELTKAYTKEGADTSKIQAVLDQKDQQIAEEEKRMGGGAASGIAEKIDDSGLFVGPAQSGSVSGSTPVAAPLSGAPPLPNAGAGNMSAMDFGMPTNLPPTAAGTGGAIPMFGGSPLLEWLQSRSIPEDQMYGVPPMPVAPGQY